MNDRAINKRITDKQQITKPENASDTTINGSASEHTIDELASSSQPAVAMERRKFLGGIGGAAAGVMLSGAAGVSASLAPQSAYGATTQTQRVMQLRRSKAFSIRLSAALTEKALTPVSHANNGDEDRYASRIGNFSKTLPHNDLGEVDPAAYNALLAAIDSESLNSFDQVPAGGFLPLLNPLGAAVYSIEGPDVAAITVNPPPALASQEFAAQLAELYWMALLRDVPFSQYDSHPVAVAARLDLASYAGYTGPGKGGNMLGANDLFRTDYPGVRDGHMTSQFLLKPFSFDGIRIEQRMSTAAPGIDYLTTFAEWLASQRGLGGGAAAKDPQARFVRNARDMGQLAAQDFINTPYLKATLIILQSFGFFAQPNDDANPYNSRPRQAGFATFGIAHLNELIGKVHKSERHAWFQKWCVHRFLRPDAASGRVHNIKTSRADYPVDEQLIKSDLLDRVFEYNRQVNQSRLGSAEGTYLLPQLLTIGAPPHPSFTAGHAITAGACVTVLKAWFDESVAFPSPVVPTDDGLSVRPYQTGADGPSLSLGGELNKLCHNMSFGRDMSGVHWRADDIEGNAQGEELAIRILAEESAIYGESFSGFSLTRFNGQKIRIQRGSIFNRGR